MLVSETYLFVVFVLWQSILLDNIDIKRWNEVGKSENWEKRKPPKFSRKQASMRNRGFLWKCSPFQIDIHDSRLTPLIFESRYDPHSIRIPIPTYLQLYKHGQHRWSWGMDRESSWLQCICRSFHESTVFFYQLLLIFCFRKRLKISRQSTPSGTQKKMSIATTMMLWKDMRLSMT